MKRRRSHTPETTSRGLRHVLSGRRALLPAPTLQVEEALPSQQVCGSSQAPMMTLSEPGQWLPSQYEDVAPSASLPPSQNNPSRYAWAAQQCQSVPCHAGLNGLSRSTTDSSLYQNDSGIGGVASLGESPSQEWSYISGDRLRREVERNSVWAATEDSHGEEFGQEHYVGIHHDHIGQCIRNSPNTMNKLVSGMDATGSYSCNTPYEASGSGSK